VSKENILNMLYKKFGEKKILVRSLKSGDLKSPEKFQKFINGLVREDVMILVCSKKTKKEELDWLKAKFANLKKKKEIYLVAEYEGRVVGSCHIELGNERHSHIAEFGISVARECRGIGLGKYLMQEAIRLAKTSLKPKIIRLSVYQGNLSAIKLYEKLGFKQVAIIPQQALYKGKLINEVVMLLHL